MKVTLNWLREFVPIGIDAATLCERLSLGGFEVEEVQEVGAEIRDVVVAEIASVERHPNAERLTVCRVDRRGGEPLAVVCGATNMKAGDRVALAPVGTTLPGGRRIECAEIRGVVSSGMLCSSAELGLDDEADGILILGREARVGESLARHLGAEDTVLALAVTPNRGDCLSMIGVAREVAALTGTRSKVRAPRVRERAEAASGLVKIAIGEPDACRRYACRVVRDVRVGPSPRWLQQRLRAVGMRPINNVVDVTNYVMMEFGQPLHAFDFDRLPAPEIGVRAARPGESIITLDGAGRELAADDLLITSGDVPVAIAGVMGGRDTEVREQTRTILLESAWFHPTWIRRTARRLDLRSEASHRFERHVNIEGVTAAIDRAAGLLAEFAHGQVCAGIVDVYPRPATPTRVGLRLGRVGDVLGTPVPRREVVRVLEALGARVGAAGRGAVDVEVPAFRSDLTREIDLVEEIARVIGYGRIPDSMPLAPLEGGRLPDRVRGERVLRQVLAGCGLCEAVTLSFSSARGNEVFPGLNVTGGAVRLMNPVSAEEPELRRSLLGGLLATWRTNRSQAVPSVSAFTIGKVFWTDGASREAWRLAGILAGQRPEIGLGAGTGVEFAEAKGVVENVLDRLGLLGRTSWEPLAGEGPFHPGRSATVTVEGGRVGVLGALHPDREAEFEVGGPHWLFELDLEGLLAYGPRHVFFRELPRYPAVVRDLAVMVDEGFASDRLIRFVLQAGQTLVEDVVLFDRYAGAPIPAGRMSLAYSISYRAADRTLTDEEVNRVHAELTAAVAAAMPVELR